MIGGFKEIKFIAPAIQQEGRGSRSKAAVKHEAGRETFEDIEEAGGEIRAQFAPIGDGEYRLGA